MKALLRKFASNSIFATPAYRPFFRDRAVVSVFHRIDDRFKGDPITCSTRQFADFCKFAADHFQVVSLTELLDRMARSEDISELLAITFDDGYVDNHDAAAPILENLGLPACFFVASGFIGSSTVPWWDRKTGAISSWMNWDQVRALARAGFEIGAHTVTHPDLGRIDNETAYREILESKLHIERELGSPVTLFAYPYGRATQITEDARESVRQIGLRCCVSCYGGTVRPGDDPFRMKRMPWSNFHQSPRHWGLQAALADYRSAEWTPN